MMDSTKAKRPEFGIGTAAGDQFIMLAFVGDASVLDDNDPVHLSHRR